jgi:hypothetical protein
VFFLNEFQGLELRVEACCGIRIKNNVLGCTVEIDLWSLINLKAESG